MLYLYSKENCPQCLQLENLLKAKAKNPYKLLKLDKDYTRENLEALCSELGKPVPRSFPVLFKQTESGVELIGTLVEAKMAVAKGEL
jgi:glutaredoxin